MTNIVKLHPQNTKALRTEIELLKYELETAYRAIERGYTEGVFDFSSIRVLARDFLAKVDEEVSAKTRKTLDEMTKEEKDRFAKEVVKAVQDHLIT